MPIAATVTGQPAKAGMRPDADGFIHQLGKASQATHSGPHRTGVGSSAGTVVSTSTEGALSTPVVFTVVTR